MFVKHHFQVCRCSTLDVYAVTVLYNNKIFTLISCNNCIPTKRAFILQSLEIDVNWGVALFSAQFST